MTSMFGCALFLNNCSKEGGLIGESRSNSKNTFYPCTVFSASHAHFQRVYSAAAGPLTTELFTTERDGLVLLGNYL